MTQKKAPSSGEAAEKVQMSVCFWHFEKPIRAAEYLIENKNNQ